MHYQDTSVHCGLACAMMLLDWLKRGNFTHPSPLPGSAMSQFRMHWWMHNQTARDPTFWTSPAQLRMLINESPVRSPVFGGLRAYEVTGSREEIMAKVDHELTNGRPAVVHTARSDTVSGHWLVVIGRSPLLPGRNTGYYALNPMVYGTWAYDEKSDDPPKLCYDYSYQSAPKSFVHTRGHQCHCPRWHGATNSALGEEFLPHVALEEQIGWGAVPPDQPDQCHAVLLSPPLRLPDIPDLIVDRQPPRPPRPFGDIAFDDPRFLKQALGELKSFGLIGRRAPAPWKRAFVNAPPTIITIKSPAKPLVLVVWPASDTSSRLAALFDRAGTLQAAAILNDWPNVRHPAAFARWFRQHARRLCASAGLAFDAESIKVTVDEELYWKPSPPSRFPWWPLYVVRVSTANQRTVKLYVDMAGRVHPSLRTGKRKGG